MTDDLLALKNETDAALAAAADLRAWDAVRVAVLGRNGSLTGLLRDLGKTPPEQRRERGAALNELKDVAFVCADVDAIDASSIRGPFDVVFCLAIEAHVKDKPHLYALLAQATSRLCLFEGNDKTDPKEAADSLRRAGFREVEALGVCDDDCRPENNVRPILRATK